MASFKLKKFTELRYDDNTNIDGTPITCYMGNDSKDSDFSKGAVGVCVKDKIPVGNTTIPTADFLVAGVSVAAVLSNVQFFCVLQKSVAGYKIKQNAGESKECSVQFYGGRNIDVLAPASGASASSMQTRSAAVGTQMYMWPHLTPKKQNNTAINLYEFQAVDLTEFNAQAITAGVNVTDELLSRCYIGRADLGKAANYLNVPVAIAPAAY